MIIDRNILYFLVVALAIVTGVLGYRYYLDHKKSDGIQIDIGKGGVSIEQK